MKKKFLFLIFIILFLISFFSIKNYAFKNAVVFCYVGEGDSTLIKIGNTQFVIDVGPKNFKSTKCFVKYNDFFDLSIEYLLLTHSDIDHIGGLENLAKVFKVKNIICNKNTFEKIKNFDFLKSSNFIILDFGDVLNLKIENTSFKIFLPKCQNISKNKQNNNTSIFVYFCSQNLCFLFPGDAECNCFLSAMHMNLINRVDILKIPHHGSKFNTCSTFFYYFRPKINVISCGLNNKFQHPHKEYLQFLQKNKLIFYRTDISGDVFLNNLHF